MAGEEGGETWYVRARGRVLGPLSWAQLRALRDRGQLARFDQVSSDRRSWVSADSLERLFPRGGAGGAFVAEGGAGGGPRPGRGPGPEADSGGFLLLDDDEAGGIAPVPPVERGTARPSADEPSDWYYAEAGAPHGPVGYGELRRLVRDGRIDPSTLYWRNGLEQWMAGSDLPELGRLWPDRGDRAAVAVGATSTGQSGVTLARDVPTSRTHPLAIASLVSNLFCGIGNLAAIVLGAIAIRQIGRSEGMQTGRDLAVAGIMLGILGLVASAVAGSWLLGGPAG